MKFYNKKNGFTLIEMLVVVVVIGLILAVGMFSYQTIFKKTKMERMKSRITSFYQRVQRRATTSGKEYLLQLDKDNKYLITFENKPAAEIEDSIGLCSDYTLEFENPNPRNFEVKPSGIVKDNEDGRNFRIFNKEGYTLKFYLSPLGILEVNK